VVVLTIVSLPSPSPSNTVSYMLSTTNVSSPSPPVISSAAPSPSM
jgi:hypothetical protein